MKEYERGYRAALLAVEREARRMPAVGNWSHNVHQGNSRQRAARRRSAKQMELGSQHLAVLRITQGLRDDLDVVAVGVAS